VKIQLCSAAANQVQHQSPQAQRQKMVISFHCFFFCMGSTSTVRPFELTVRSVTLPYGPSCQGPDATALPSHGPLCTCRSHLLLLHWLWLSLAPCSTLSSHSGTGPALPQQTRLHFKNGVRMVYSWKERTLQLYAKNGVVMERQREL